MMKKRLMTLASLTLSLCFLLSGCSGSKSAGTEPAGTGTVQQAEAVSDENTEEAQVPSTAMEPAASGAQTETTAPEETGTTAETVSAAAETTVPEDTTIRSILTNEEIDPELKNQRPLAVMYPINYEAQPQYGLNKVDVFYEMIEEGNMSRQMGIIQDWQGLDMIGNIRSTRSYFVLEAMRYDPIMIHFGGPIDWLKPVTDREDLDNLNGVGGVLGGDYGAYFRVNNGKAMEHTAYTSAEYIRNACALAGYKLEIRPEYYEERQFYFNAPDDRNTLEQYEDSIPATNIDMSGAFPVTQSSLVYNPEDHKYYKYLYGEPQCDAVTGEQMAFDNVIIQEAKFKYVGNHGYVDLDTISRGRNAYVLTEGRCVPAHWWRKDVHKHTTYYYKDKTRIHLNTGKTMIFIIRDHLDTFALDGVSYSTQGEPLTPAY
ncbi:MAG: DUF3048 domain-containing protein [Eubacteriales bacterium]|nr:DUF3048 domain-containing protein [Eubacteriales bacterium]